MPCIFCGRFVFSFFGGGLQEVQFTAPRSNNMAPLPRYWSHGYRFYASMVDHWWQVVAVAATRFCSPDLLFQSWEHFSFLIVTFNGRLQMSWPSQPQPPCRILMGGAKRRRKALRFERSSRTEARQLTNCRSTYTISQSFLRQ